MQDNSIFQFQWQRNQLAVTLSAACIATGFTLAMPFLPLYIQQLGVSSPTKIAIWSGVLIGISPLIASFVGPFWGKLADQYGLKIMAIRISTALFLIWALMGLSRNVYELLFLRILSGLFGGFGSLSVSLLTQSCPPNKVSEAIGSLQATQTVSFALGPLIGGILAGWIGIRYTFFFTSALCLATLIFFQILYKNTKVQANLSLDEWFLTFLKGILRLFRLPNFKIFAVLLLTASIIDRTFIAAIPLLVTTLTKNPLHIAPIAGLILSSAACGEGFAAWYSGRKIGLISTRKLFLKRLFFGFMFCVGLMFVQSNEQLLVLRLLLALLAGGIITISYSKANQIIPSNQRATAFALLSSFMMLGNAFGPFFAGLLASIDFQFVFLVDAFLYTALFALVHQTIKKENSYEV